MSGDRWAASRAGATTYAYAMATYFIGQYVSSQFASTAGTAAQTASSLSATGIAVKVILHALAGGIHAKASGGSVQDGALAAGVSAFVSGKGWAGPDGEMSTQGLIVSALVGGTVSRLSGGKFANGAFYGFMTYILNNASPKKTHEGGGVDQDGIPGKLKLSTGEENPNRNTVVTDGNGGLVVQLSTKAKKAYPVIQDAITAHEEQHIKDFMEYGTNLEILEGQPAGRPINFSPAINKGVLERRAYRAEINYLEDQMLNNNLSPRVLYDVNVRLNVLDNQHDKYSN